jgi:hypothetical protein
VDLHVELLSGSDVDDPAPALRPHEEAAHLLQRALRGGQADALRLASSRFANERVQALQGQRQVGAALGRGHGVDLVHDPSARAACLARGRSASGATAVVIRMSGVSRIAARALRGVAGADRHADVGTDPAQGACRLR